MIFNSFAMMNHHHPHNHQPQQQELVLHQQSSLKRESLSDEVDSEEHKKQKHDAKSSGSGGGGDGASIEVMRRPRGRPPGSKNKPKPPVIITREADPSSAMRPYVLEIPGGLDITDALARFSRRRNLGICILSGTGTVVNVVLRQQPPPAAHGDQAATVGFRGRFEILSLSATFLPPPLAAVSAAPSVSISLAGPQGQVVGGTVAGPLVAAGTVVVVAAAFSNPSFHRLPAEEEVSVSLSGGGGDVVEASGQEPDYKYDHGQDQDPHLQHHHHHQQQQQQHRQQAVESCGMSVYSCHLPSDVIWAPTAARPPPPPPY